MTGYQKGAILKAATNFAEEIQRIFEQPRSPEAELVSKPPRDNMEAMRMAGAPDWEILKFRSIGRWDNIENNIWSKDQNDLFGPGFSEDSMLNGCGGSVKDGRWAIHSVRRLYDNTIFTIGDTSSMGSIKAFKIENVKDMGAILENGHWINIHSLNKAKPLFTTADGAEIEEGADVWELSNGNISQLQFYKNKTYSGKLYSTEEAAGDARKPLFVTADGVEVFGGDTVWFIAPPHLTAPMECPAKANCNPKAHYSTRRAALMGYENWLLIQPALTVAEVLQFHSADYTEMSDRLKVYVTEKLRDK